MTDQTEARIGFTHPESGERWLLIGSHTSTVRVGGPPAKRWPGCPGCHKEPQP